ncbi:MAG TPA: hypothetical protein VGM29_08745 [Polyangiaceae bacterium]
MRRVLVTRLAWIPVLFSANGWAQAGALPPPPPPPPSSAAQAPEATSPSSAGSLAPSAPALNAAAPPATPITPLTPAPAAPPQQPAPTPQQTPASNASAPPAVELSLSALNAPGSADRSAEVPFKRRNYAAMPLLIDARYGVDARLASAFGGTQEELLDSTFALGVALSMSAELAATFDIEHAGLGRVNALTGQTSVDASYSVTTPWLGLRAFPWHSERVDLFLSLRAGLAIEHVSAVGTRQSALFVAPATPFSCSETADPGFAISGGVGLIYRLSQHLSFMSRFDGEGYRITGDALGNCALGIGAVTAANLSVGVGYEFETAPADDKAVARR